MQSQRAPRMQVRKESIIVSYSSTLIIANPHTSGEIVSRGKSSLLIKTLLIPQTNWRPSNQGPWMMLKEVQWKPSVTYDSVTGREKEAEVGLDRAFNLLFEEVLKTDWKESKNTKRPKPEP